MNSTNLLSSLAHLRVRKATFIQTFDFSTLYSSVPHDFLMNNIINNTFKHKNGAARYTHIKVGRNKSYFSFSDPLNGDSKYTANDICKMTEFLVDNIQGVPKNLLQSGEHYIVISRFSSVFSWCLTRGVINAARIVLFKFYN